MQSPKNLPTITQAYPGWLYIATQNKILVNLTPYINNKNVVWGSAKKSGIRTELLDGAKISNTQYGLPFNKSIESLFYNKTMFKKYGIKKVPSTMAELKEVSQEIYKKSTLSGYDFSNVLSSSDVVFSFSCIIINLAVQHPCPILPFPL